MNSGETESERHRKTQSKGNWTTVDGCQGDLSDTFSDLVPLFQKGLSLLGIHQLSLRTQLEFLSCGWNSFVAHLLVLLLWW